MKTQQKSQKLRAKFTNDDLKRMQSWDLDRKIAVSLTKIAEFYSKFPHKIYVLSLPNYHSLSSIEFATPPDSNNSACR